MSISQINLGNMGRYYFTSGGDAIIVKDGKITLKLRETGVLIDITGCIVVTDEVPEGDPIPQRETKNFIIEIDTVWSRDR